MVSIVNPKDFWFRVRLYLRAKNLSLKWLARSLGRRESFITNRSEQEKVTNREAEQILSILGISVYDMNAPIEIFATKHLQVEDGNVLGGEREIRGRWEAGATDLDEM